MLSLFIILILFSTTINVSSQNQDKIQLEEKPVEQTSSRDGDLMNSSWPMKCHDRHHTSQTPYSTADNPGVEKWRFKTEYHGHIESSAVIDKDGVIYFGSMGSDCKLYALYTNGTKKMELSNMGFNLVYTCYRRRWNNLCHLVR